MLKALLLPLPLILAVMATAQNLVPNPSFEDTARCGAYDILNLQMPPWFNPNNATPDVYDNDLADPCGIPWDPNDPDAQDQGYQDARTGTRFAGAFHWYGPGASDTKEYLMTRLMVDLEAGQAYEVALYYNRPDGYLLATDRISVYFAVDSFHFGGYATIDVEPQVNLSLLNGEYLTEAEDWVQLVDTFVATGGERYMVIGSFQDSSEVDGILLPPGWVDWQYAYYYYDDISVRPVNETSIAELDLFHASGQGMCRYRWNADWAAEDLQLFDLRGTLVTEQRVAWMPGDQGTIPFDCASGVYIAQATGKGRRSTAKLHWLRGEL